jgi:hypothetical protein
MGPSRSLPRRLVESRICRRRGVEGFGTATCHCPRHPSMSPLDPKAELLANGKVLFPLESAPRLLSGIRLFALPIGPHVSAMPAASLARKSRLKIRQANVIRPSVAANRSPVTAMIITAIDQQAANARGAHVGEADLLRAVVAYYFRRSFCSASLANRSVRSRSKFLRAAI